MLIAILAGDGDSWQRQALCGGALTCLDEHQAARFDGGDGIALASQAG